jgi:hypothetical protein
MGICCVWCVGHGSSAIAQRRFVGMAAHPATMVYVTLSATPGARVRSLA